MNRSLRIVVALLTLGLFCVSSMLLAARTDAEIVADQISKKIELLGHEQYTVRDQAEQQLIEMGMAAFDQLLAATEHDDLEIASRASYLLPRLKIQWFSEHDSEVVRDLLREYQSMSQEDQEQCIHSLAKLPEYQGLAALCRIARYETSPIVARMAALAVLNDMQHEEAVAEEGATIVGKEMADCVRLPVQWIRKHFKQHQQADSTKSGWLEEIDREITLQNEDSNKTNAETVFHLLKYYLGVCKNSAGVESAVEPLERMMAMRLGEGGELRRGLIFALSWCTEHKQWQVITELEKRYEEQIKKDRFLLYLVAEATERAGDVERAQEIAERAFRLDVGEVGDRNEVASGLAEIGRHDWAEREWRFVIESLPASDSATMVAQRQLPTFCLYDRREYQKAADMVGGMLDEINQQMKKNKNLKLRYSGKEARKYLNRYRAQHNYFLACVEETKANYEQQRIYLESALKLDSENPDILIAMYRSPEADAAYKKKIVARIVELSDKLQQMIDDDPSVPHHWNHWAWLISNTEGDYQQAVKYSLRSLEVMSENPGWMSDVELCYLEMRAEDIMPPSPSYLDTLGRCYFAVGDLENAIKYQREAIDRHPHLQVMQRQLKMFEQALAARDTK